MRTAKQERFSYFAASAMGMYDLADRPERVLTQGLLVISSEHDADYVATAEAPDRFCEDAAFITNTLSWLRSI